MTEFSRITLRGADAPPVVLRAGTQFPLPQAHLDALSGELLNVAEKMVHVRGVWALARKNFAKNGRGVLFVLHDPESEAIVPVLRYYNVESLRRAMSACPRPFVERIMRYDPETACLVVVARVLAFDEPPAIVGCAIYEVKFEK